MWYNLTRAALDEITSPLKVILKDTDALLFIDPKRITDSDRKEITTYLSEACHESKDQLKVLWCLYGNYSDNWDLIIGETTWFTFVRESGKMKYLIIAKRYLCSLGYRYDLQFLSKTGYMTCFKQEVVHHLIRRIQSEVPDHKTNIALFCFFDVRNLHQIINQVEKVVGSKNIPQIYFSLYREQNLQSDPKAMSSRL